MEAEIKRNITKIMAFAGIAWFSYNVFRYANSKRPIEKAIEKTVEPVKDAGEAVIDVAAKVVEVPVEIVKKAAHLIKGSPEAKEYFRKLREKKKEKHNNPIDIVDNPKYAYRPPKTGETLEDKKHKGHSTKKGLSQDQKLLSDEPHEKSYRKQKYMSEHHHKKKHKHFLFTL